ncbi:MAG: oligopeptide transporter, OPT family, partial [Leptospiraceae bacterium]|nr:oligopeptide transporter, OPT family [Leptospiraceae bacterium]
MKPREFTLRAVGLGLLLSVVLGAANTYLGLYAGLTVSASIPAAVLSMFILRKWMRSGTILENNIVQSMASAGESLAAGIIFTIPALVISKEWHDFAFWPTTLVAFCGGMLGVLFLIPFRKQFIAGHGSRQLQEDLIYPEGHACAEVLRSGESKGALSIFSGMASAIALKCSSLLFQMHTAFVIPIARNGGRAAFLGLDFSAALAGVGYIVGIRIASMLFLGGFITWAIILPVFAPLNPATSMQLQIHHFWASQGRFAGVGAMLVGTIE